MERHSEDFFQAIRENRYEDSQEILDQVIQTSIEKDQVEDLNYFGEDLIASGFLDEAKKVFNSLIEHYPQTDYFYLGLAQAQIEASEFDDSLDTLLAIEQDSENYLVSLTLQADVYSLTGLPEVAQVKLDEALNIAPDEPILHVAKGQVLAGQGQYQAALNTYEKAVDLEPALLEDETFLRAMGENYLAMGQFEEGINLLESNRHKEDDELDYLLANFYFQNEENQRARQLFFELKDRGVESSSLDLMYAQTLAVDHELAEAFSVLEVAIERDPFQSILFFTAANLAIELIQNDKALDYFSRGLEIEPDNISAQIQYIALLMREEDFEGAEEQFERVDDLNLTDPQLDWLRADLANINEDFELARDYYSRAYQVLNESPEFLGAYARFAYEDGNRSLVQELVDIYLTYEPADEEIQALKERLKGEDV